MSRRRWSVLAFAAASVTAVVLALAPTGTSVACTSMRPAVCTTTHDSLYASEGASVLLVLAVPVLLTAAPLAWPRRPVAIVVAVALNVLVVLGALSIGVFLVPTLVLAWIAALRTAAD